VRFKELQNSYAVLSDANERAWYGTCCSFFFSFRWVLIMEPKVRQSSREHFARQFCKRRRRRGTSRRLCLSRDKVAFTLQQESSVEPGGINLWPYFSTSAYSGTPSVPPSGIAYSYCLSGDPDSAGGFFGVYRDLFDRLHGLEAAAVAAAKYAQLCCWFKPVLILASVAESLQILLPLGSVAPQRRSQKCVIFWLCS
jgi:hypothetical protein